MAKRPAMQATKRQQAKRFKTTLGIALGGKIGGRAKPLTDEQRKAATKEIEKRDFDLWFERAKVTKARKDIEAAIGCRISPAAFKECRKSCRWFGIKPRPNPSTEKLLDSKGWQRLRNAVAKHSESIRGRSLDEAVAIISLHCPCNRYVLSGLRSDLRFWTDDYLTLAEPSICSQWKCPPPAKD